jgi:hypothetical protein
VIENDKGHEADDGCHDKDYDGDDNAGHDASGAVFKLEKSPILVELLSDAL